MSSVQRLPPYTIMLQARFIEQEPLYGLTVTHRRHTSFPARSRTNFLDQMIGITACSKLRDPKYSFDTHRHRRCSSTPALGITIFMELEDWNLGLQYAVTPTSTLFLDLKCFYNTYETVTKSARFDQFCMTVTKGVDGQEPRAIPELTLVWLNKQLQGGRFIFTITAHQILTT